MMPVLVILKLIYRSNKETKMKIFRRLKIESAKQIGTLYHLTNLTGLNGILRSNSIKSSNLYDGVSFTRDKMLNSYKSRNRNLFFKLLIDGNKLSENFKINPNQYIQENGRILFESEEFIKIKELKDLNKYLLGIAFVYDNWKPFEQKFKDSDLDEIIVEDRDIKYKKKDILSIIKKIPPEYLLLQRGSSIKKDTNWFKEEGLI